MCVPLPDTRHDHVQREPNGAKCFNVELLPLSGHACIFQRTSRMDASTSDFVLAIAFGACGSTSSLARDLPAAGGGWSDEFHPSGSTSAYMLPVRVWSSSGVGWTVPRRRLSFQIWRGRHLRGLRGRKGSTSKADDEAWLGDGGGRARRNLGFGVPKMRIASKCSQSSTQPGSAIGETDWSGRN